MYTVSEGQPFPSSKAYGEPHFTSAEAMPIVAVQPAHQPKYHCPGSRNKVWKSACARTAKERAGLPKEAITNATPLNVESSSVGSTVSTVRSDGCQIEFFDIVLVLLNLDRWLLQLLGNTIADQPFNQHKAGHLPSVWQMHRHTMDSHGKAAWVAPLSYNGKAARRT